MLQACAIFFSACWKNGGMELQKISDSQYDLGDNRRLGNGAYILAFRNSKLHYANWNSYGNTVLQDHEAGDLPVWGKDKEMQKLLKMIECA